MKSEMTRKIVKLLIASYSLFFVYIAVLAMKNGLKSTYKYELLFSAIIVAASWMILKNLKRDE